MYDPLTITLGQLLDHQAAQHPTHDALIHIEEALQYTYQQFHTICNDMARGLIALGLNQGNHVAIWAPNRSEWVVAQFATAKAGLVLVNINPNYRRHDLQYALQQSDAQALLVTDEEKYLTLLNDLLPTLATSERGQLQSDIAPRLRTVIAFGEAQSSMHNWADLPEIGREVSLDDLLGRQKSIKPTDVVNIQYTSGAAGFPKGAMLTHRNIISNSHTVMEGMRFTDQDRLCIPMPFFHCFGSTMGTLGCVTHGATMVIPSRYYDPLTVLTAIQQERCTGLYGVPTMFQGQLEHEQFADFDLSSLRTGVMSGGPCPIELMQQVVEKMNAHQMTIAYGLTEASPAITQTLLDDPLEQRVSTVGKPIAGVTVKVVDPESGQTLSAGQAGELCAKGPNIMSGYYAMPQATERAIDADGWLHTNDKVVMTEDGYFKIVGTLHDMVIRGGENIYPREVEEYLYLHPDIADVRVIGVPDMKFGEELMAWVVLTEGASLTAEALQAQCKGQIASYKIPKYIKFVAELPAADSEQSRKVHMRTVAIDELGLQEAAARATA